MKETTEETLGIATTTVEELSPFCKAAIDSAVDSLVMLKSCCVNTMRNKVSKKQKGSMKTMKNYSLSEKQRQTLPCQKSPSSCKACSVLLPLSALSKFRCREIEKMYDLKEKLRRVKAVQAILYGANRERRSDKN